MAKKRSTGGSSRRYPRTARLNELLREIIAEELERIDDERLGLLTIMAVEVDPGIEHAKIHWSNMSIDDDDTVLAVLEEHRPRLQRAVNNQTRLRRTPILSFHADEVLRSAQRVEDILRSLETSRVDEAEDPATAAEEADTED